MAGAEKLDEDESSQTDRATLFNLEYSDDVRAIITASRAGLSMPMIDDVYSIKTHKKQWFVVYTNPKCEEKAEGGISEHSFSAYVPKSTTWRKRSRRAKHQKAPKVKVSRPLFTRYVMVEMPMAVNGESPFGAVRKIDGVREFVAAAGNPICLRPFEIDNIKEREEMGAFDDTMKKGRVIAPRWAIKGAACKVVDGPFAGFTGRIEECLPRDRVKVAVYIFGRSTPLELELDQINPE